MDMQSLPIAQFAGIIYLAVLLFFGLLSLLIPFFIWRIWRWSYISSQELVKLNGKLDELLTISASPPQPGTTDPVVEQLFGSSDEPVEETEELEPSSMPEAAQAVSMESAFEETAEEEAEEDQDFNFEEDLPEETSPFGETPEEDFFPEEPEEKPAEDFSFEEETATESFEETPQEDNFDDLALSGEGFDNQAAFSMDEEEELPGAEEPQEEPFADSPFGSTAEEEEPFADSSFGATAEEEEPAAEFLPPAPEEEPAPVEPEEEKPSIIRLPDNPKTPDVNLARCAICDHKLSYRKALAGKKAKCPSCKTVFTLP